MLRSRRVAFSLPSNFERLGGEDRQISMKQKETVSFLGSWGGRFSSSFGAGKSEKLDS